MADATLLAYQAGSILANGKKFQKNIGGTSLERITAGINAASFLQNAVAFKNGIRSASNCFPISQSSNQRNA